MKAGNHVEKQEERNQKELLMYYLLPEAKKLYTICKGNWRLNQRFLFEDSLVEEAEQIINKYAILVSEEERTECHRFLMDTLWYGIEEEKLLEVKQKAVKQVEEMEDEYKMTSIANC